MLPLLSLLKKVSDWSSCEVDAPLQNQLCVTLKTGAVVTVTKSECEDLDNRLWDTIFYLSTAQPNTRLVVIQLETTLKHWLGLLPQHPDVLPYAVISYDRVLSDNPEGKAVNVALSVGEIAVVGTTEVVTNKLMTQASLPYSWLEDHYPGSVSRMQSARALLMSPSEQAYHMLNGQETSQFHAEILDTVDLLG